MSGRRFSVPVARREGARLQGQALAARAETIRYRLDCVDAPAQQACAVPLGLGPHTTQQLRAADAVREARVIMGDRNPKRPTIAIVDDRDPAMVAREVDRSRQSGRPTADDQAVEPL